MANLYEGMEEVSEWCPVRDYVINGVANEDTINELRSSQEVPEGCGEDN